MSKLERLLVPIFLATLAGALLLEDASPESVRRIALGCGAVLAVMLLGGFAARYVRHRRVTAEARRAEAAAREGADHGPSA